MMIYSYLKLGVAALLPVLLSVVLYWGKQKQVFKKLNHRGRQVLYGMLFGVLAILGTEWGIPFYGAQANCRDAAVLCAGLLFGAPAGIIAGVIGGVERWFAVYWGVGTFTRAACTVSTILAGFYAAALRKFMFDNKRTGALLSCAVGVVMEVFHLTMVFLTNMSQPVEAMRVVQACSVPLVVSNAASVMLASFLLDCMSNKAKKIRHKKVGISQTMQRWLLLAVVFAFVATTFFIMSLQNRLATVQADHTLERAVHEIVSDLEEDIPAADVTRNRRVGEDGCVMVLDEAGHILGLSNEDYRVERVILPADAEDASFEMMLANVNAFVRYARTGDYTVLALLPMTEVMELRNIALYVNTYMEILVFAIMFGMIYLLINLSVVKQIDRVNVSLTRITEGDLDEQVDVRTSEEFAALSDDINATVHTLKQHIEREASRIDQELEAAKSIQFSALPSLYPYYAGRTDMDLHAYMCTAKEVGGDFYDFYQTDRDTLNLLIADVSGKGIPAAMFMMRAKTELKNLTCSGSQLADSFIWGNNNLCQNNDAGMFVTAWQGQLNLNTGLLKYVNAGHNAPLVRHGSGTFEYLHSPANFILGGMENMKYRERELQLQRGDIVFLYTDGVTEATNAQKQLYGDERLRGILNACEYETMEDICKAVKADVDAFVGDAPQFDDITMLALRYTGREPAWKMQFDEAKLEDIPILTEKANEELERLGCPMHAMTQFSIAIDEIYSNVVKYAYPKDKPGPVSLTIQAQNMPHGVALIFEDAGAPYNPLTNSEPDVTLSAEEREIGGLGLFIVKKSMDEVQYRYERSHNIFTIKKYI